MNEQMTLTTTRQSAVAPWANREDVRELSERLQAMMPGGNKLTQVEALTLAQAAVAHGLDPLNGELWYLKDRAGRPIGLMAGIKGHRRAAHLQMKQEGGGNYWPEFEELTIDEKPPLGIPPNALAFRCKVRDTQTLNEYVSQIERLSGAGLPWEIVSDIVGARPYTEGIGYAMPDEPSRMTRVQLAMKRAEADALKRRFDLPFGSAVGVNGDTDVTNGEFVVVDDTPSIPEEVLEHNRAILHGDAKEADWDAVVFKAGDDAQPAPDGNGHESVEAKPEIKPRSWPGDHIKAIVDAKLAEKAVNAVNMLNRSNLSTKDEVDVCVAWAKQYRTSRDAGGSVEDAATVANTWWDSERPA